MESLRDAFERDGFCWDVRKGAEFVEFGKKKVEESYEGIEVNLERFVLKES